MEVSVNDEIEFTVDASSGVAFVTICKNGNVMMDDITIEENCCSLNVNCPLTDLGSIVCDETPPPAADDETSFEGLGGTINSFCGTLSITSEDVYNECSSITRTYTISDDENSLQCTQNITITGISAPVITCPSDTQIESDESIDPSNTGEATATSDCFDESEITITFSDETTQNGNISGAIITRTWTATLPCGLSNTCNQTIIVNGNPPIIHPEDPDDSGMEVTVDCDLGFIEYYDNGGEHWSYNRDAPATTITFCPSDPTCQKVQIDFNEFDLAPGDVF